MLRLVKYLRNILLLLASLVCLLLVFLYFAPGPLIRPLANAYLNTVGFPIEEVSGARFTFNESHVADLTISNEQNTFVLRRLELEYRFFQLLQGKVDSLRIDEVELILGESQEQETSPDSSLVDMIESVKMMPLASISVGKLNFNDQTQLSNIDFDLSPENFSAALDYEEFSLTGLGDWSDSSRLEGNLLISQATDILVDTNYALLLGDQSLSWQGQSQLSLTQLQKLAVLEGFFATHQPANESVLVESEFSVDGIFTELAIPRYALTLSNAEESDLGIISQLESGKLHSAINLPISLRGSAIDLMGAISFNLEAFTNQFSWQSEALTSNGHLSLRQISGSCTLQFDCSSNQQLHLTLNDLQTADFPALTLSFEGEFSTDKIGDNVDLNLKQQARATLTGLAFPPLTVASVNWQTLSSGTIDYNLQTNMISMAMPSSQIELKDLQSAYALTQLGVDLTDLRVDLEESLRSNFAFSTNAFIPGLENYNPIDPGLIGSLSYHDNSVELSLDLLLKNRQILRNQIVHDLTSGNGSALIEIPELLFSNITPLSSFFEELPITAELISGTIGARAQLNWQLSDQDPLQLSGPVDLSIKDLGGFYNEIVFVGFQTHVLAQVNSANEIQSAEQLQASLETLDIGTPVENIRLRYQFDSAGLAARIEDFYAELLGGSISVTEFDYQQQRPKNVLTVNLDAVQLNAIAAMAEYPNLYVDGAVSGRVPIVISADRISVDQGVIVAENPGGVIRYTSANPVPNPNSTMRLVNDALSNYHYKSLDSDVIYDENGDLILAVKMRGANPDLNAGQEINLNLNITDNIPTLLRSLQASRVITDTLEQAIQDRQNSR